MLFAYVVMLHGLTGLRPLTLLRAFWRVLAAGAVLAGVVAILAPLLHGLSGLRLALELGGVVLAGAATYGAALLLLGFRPAHKALANLRSRWRVR